LYQFAVTTTTVHQSGCIDGVAGSVTIKEQHMLKSAPQKGQASQQQEENVPATKKTKWKNAPKKSGEPKPLTKRRLGADGLPEAAVSYIDHAPVHPVYIHADGLFRPVAHGQGDSSGTISKIYSMGAAKILCQWQSQQALNIVDQSVLFFICQLAAQPSRVFGVVPAAANVTAMTKSLNAVGLCSDLEHCGVKTTLPEIARGIGLTPTGTNSHAMLESLNRLAATRMTRTVLDGNGNPSEKSGQSNVIGLVCGDEFQYIVLNIELTKACSASGTVSWVNMREYRSIKSKPAKRLHAWLSNWASTRETRVVDLSLLPKHIWGHIPCTTSASKSRAHTLRAAIQEIARLPGWICFVDADKKRLMVRKPIFAGTKAVTAATLTTPAATTSTTAERKTSKSLKSSTGVALQEV
jgi:hypothetical protein